MQRVRMRLDRIQQDPLLTPTTSLTGIKPKQLIRSDYQDYSVYDHYRHKMIHEHALYPEWNDSIEKQIREDVLVWRQLQEEERRPGFKINSTNRICCILQILTICFWPPNTNLTHQ